MRRHRSAALLMCLYLILVGDFEREGVPYFATLCCGPLQSSSLDMVNRTVAEQRAPPKGPLKS